MFGANLRQLASKAQSISALCRDLGINRTQFNRYLAGESFPRPDVLHRICDFFDVDARILLEPVAQISNQTDTLFHHPEIRDFLGDSDAMVAETDFPTGFYRFSRRSFMERTQFLVGLVYVYRRDGRAFVRGYESKRSMTDMRMPASAAEREYRGCVLPQENGLAMLISRRHALTFSFTYLSPQASFQNNIWVGYTSRTSRESVTGERAVRIVFEHLGDRLAEVLTTARQAGLITLEEVLPFHRTQLQVNEPFR